MATMATDWSWSQPYNAPTLPQPQSQPPPPSQPAFSNPALFAPIPENAPLPSFPAQQPLTSTEQPQWQARPIRPSLTTRLSSNSRKRSRDDADSDDLDSSAPSTARRTPSPPKADPAYALHHQTAASQTGTWAEELSGKLALLRSNSFDQDGRPQLTSRKSLRLDRSATNVDDVTMAALPSHSQSASAREVGAGATTAYAAADPTIDIATQTLGIGWTAIPTTWTSEMHHAARGWARFIENNFPLQSVRVVWHNRSMPAYLVSAATRPRHAWQARGGEYDGGMEGWWLFDEELTACRLVARSWEGAIEGLRAGTWEGESVVKRGEGFGYGGGSGRGEGEAEVEPYFMKGMAMAEGGLQGRDGRWDAPMGGQGVVAVGGGGDGMDVD